MVFLYKIFVWQDSATRKITLKTTGLNQPTAKVPTYSMLFYEAQHGVLQGAPW